MTPGVQEQHCIKDNAVTAINVHKVHNVHLVRSHLLTLKQFDLMPKVNRATICSRFRTEAEPDFLV